MINAHLEGYKARGNIPTSRGSTFRKVMGNYFPKPMLQYGKSG